jgi:hypothetical protein
MKKRLIFILIAVFSLTAAFSTKVDSTETLRLSLTVTNVVYVGVTDQAITSSIVPSTNYTMIGFYFDPSTGMWKTEDAYIYVISFVSNPIKVKLQNTTLVKVADGDAGGSPESLTYTGTATAVEASKTYEKSNSIDFGTDETGAQYIYEETEPTFTVTSGNTTTKVQRFIEARIKSWQFNVVVDPDNYGSTTVINSGAKYQATFTITIEGV